MNNGDRRVGAIMTAAAFAFLTAAVTLVTQILVYRIVSAKFLNNYAFLVISLTMLGFAFSGVVLTRHLDGALRRINEAMTWFTALFIISLLSGTSLFYQVVAAGNYPASRMDFFLIILKTLPYVFVFLPPFAFAGLILGTLLSAPSYPTGRIYFSDLVDSGFGAFVVIPAISRLGLEECLLLTCALFVAGSLFCYRPKGAPSRIAMGAAIVLLVIATVKKEAFFKLRYPSNTMLSSVEELGEPYGIEYTAWDPIGRIEVSRIPPPHPDQTPYPSLIGSNREFHHQIKRMITQNNFAFTYAVDYDGRPESIDGIKETIYAAAYQAAIAPNPKVITIGVGGGIDVLTALAFHAREVTGVEINAATVDILTDSYREYFMHWVDDPKVNLILSEGRQYLASSKESYDVIQLSGVDTYSGTSAAAHVFSENYLYTAEAFDLYLSRLSDEGVLNMIRLEHTPPREMFRALTTACSALSRVGAKQPAHHIITVSQTNGKLTALLVKKTPFTGTDVERVVD